MKTGIELYQTQDGYEISIDGYSVPNVRWFPHESAANDGQGHLVLDRRFSTVDCDESEMKNWIVLIAHAMAIGAGYSSFGANSRKVNPYGGGPIGEIPEGAEQL